MGILSSLFGRKSEADESSLKLLRNAKKIGIKTSSNQQENEIVWLTDETQTAMYNGTRTFMHAATTNMRKPTRESLVSMKQAIVPLVDAGKEIAEWLYSNQISISAEDIVSAFYLVNTADMQFKDPLSFPDNIIRNTLATIIVVGLEQSSFTAEDVTPTAINDVRETINWLVSHPTN